MKIADMHCDTISEIWESRKQSVSQNGGSSSPAMICISISAR